MSSPDFPPNSFDIFEEIGEEPEAQLQIDCDCWRLSRPLESNNRLPDHICPETAYATTRKRRRRQFEDHFGHLDLDRIKVLNHASECSQEVPLGRFLDRESSLWPMPYRGRHLAFVIQQWADGDSSRAMAELLAKDRRWQREVSQMRRLCQVILTMRADNPFETAEHFHENRLPVTPFALAPPLQADAEFIDEWVRQSGWSTSTLGRLGQDEDAADQFESRLRCNGLPYTPATMCHLRALAAGRREPLPAPRLLITTLAYFMVNDDLTLTPRQNPELHIVGPLTDGAATKISTAAQRVAREHRKFIER